MTKENNARGLVAALVAAMLVAGCGEQPANRITLSAAEFGGSWPLTVDAALLYCPQPNAPMLDTAQGLVALNGVAAGMGGKMLAADSPMWKDSPGGDGIKVSMGPLIERALALCGAEK